LLGCGAHIAALRRTASGTFRIDEALPLAEAERLGPTAASRLISLSAALPHLAAVRVTSLGLRRALHGNALEPVHLEGPGLQTETSPVKILSADGELVALAQARAGVLHPTVVLG
jgi:tRNA pseudouridine55 synthase